MQFLSDALRVTFRKPSEDYRWGMSTGGVPLPNRRSGDTSRRQARKGVLSHRGAMPAVEFFALGFVGPVVAKFALRNAFEAAPELARVFEVHLPAGIAEGLRRSCLALKRAVAVLAGFGLER